jgi:hypothetical protein
MLDIKVIKAGLKIMAKKYPRYFADIVNGDADEETGDVFLQCCLFGKWSDDASTITNRPFKKK